MPNLSAITLKDIALLIVEKVHGELHGMDNDSLAIDSDRDGYIRIKTRGDMTYVISVTEIVFLIRRMMEEINHKEFEISILGLYKKGIFIKIAKTIKLDVGDIRTEDMLSMFYNYANDLRILKYAKRIIVLEAERNSLFRKSLTSNAKRCMEPREIMTAVASSMHSLDYMCIWPLSFAYQAIANGKFTITNPHNFRRGKTSRRHESKADYFKRKAFWLKHRKN